jgi:hypothetical protein
MRHALQQNEINSVGGGICECQLLGSNWHALTRDHADKRKASTCEDWCCNKNSAIRWRIVRKGNRETINEGNCNNNVERMLEDPLMDTAWLRNLLSIGSW